MQESSQRDRGHNAAAQTLTFTRDSEKGANFIWNTEMGSFDDNW